MIVTTDYYQTAGEYFPYTWGVDAWKTSYKMAALGQDIFIVSLGKVQCYLFVIDFGIRIIILSQREGFQG